MVHETADAPVEVKTASPKVPMPDMRQMPEAGMVHETADAPVEVKTASPEVPMPDMRQMPEASVQFSDPGTTVKSAEVPDTVREAGTDAV
eukprot:Skav227589  [mRNA]  locus=scaffold1141:153609:155349:+ [translate_table: standard]